jgi:hypothetical protein
LLRRKIIKKTPLAQEKEAKIKDELDKYLASLDSQSLAMAKDLLGRESFKEEIGQNAEILRGFVDIYRENPELLPEAQNQLSNVDLKPKGLAFPTTGNTLGDLAVAGTLVASLISGGVRAARAIHNSVFGPGSSQAQEESNVNQAGVESILPKNKNRELKALQKDAEASSYLQKVTGVIDNLGGTPGKITSTRKIVNR